jgi:hypothetical protein
MVSTQHIILRFIDAGREVRRSPLVGMDFLHEARTDPARRGKPAWVPESVRLATTVGDLQADVFIEGSALDRFPTITFRRKRPHCARRWRVSFAKNPSTALSQDAEVGVKWKWTRRRLRAVTSKQWKRGTTRELRRRGVGWDLAARTAGSPHGPWRLSNSPALTIALPNAFLASLGLASLAITKAA